MKTRRSIVTLNGIKGRHKGQRPGSTHMDEAHFSEDATWKRLDNSPYGRGFSRTKLYNDHHFPLKNEVLDVSDQIISTVEAPQEKATQKETCRNADMALTLGKMKENAVKKKYDQDQVVPTNPHVSAKGDLLKMNISDILQHHLSKEEFLKGEGIDCETLPEISNADSFDEAIVKNVTLCSANSCWPKEQTSELMGQANPKRDNEPCCAPATTEKSTSKWEELVATGHGSHLESSNVLTETKSLSHKQKVCLGQTPQNQQTEKTRSGQGFKYDHIHYRFSDFSNVAPEGKIPESNIIDKPCPMDKQASFSPGLRARLALVQDILEGMSSSNCAEEEEQRGETSDPSGQGEMEATRHIRQEHLTGIESETSLFKLTSTSQKDPSSSSSYIFQKISRGKKMCQRLKEQTDRLKSKVQEFSKSIAQDSPRHVQDKRLVLEELQGHLESLEQEFVAKKEHHRTVEQHAHAHDSSAVSAFDPERKEEGEIFQLEMLLEEVRETVDEGQNASAGSLPVISAATQGDLSPTSSPPSEEQDPHSTSRSREREEHAETTGRSGVFCHQVIEWKQNMEEKGHGRTSCGRLPTALQEKALHSDSISSPDTELSCYSALATRWRSNKCRACGAKILPTPRGCHKDPLREFHYRYNTPGQNYPNHGGQNAFVQLCFLNENKNSSPSCSKPNWISSKRANSKSSQDEPEPILGEKNLTAFRTYSSDLALSSPDFRSCRISGSESSGNLSSTEETKSEDLHSSLDHALRTAIVLKETTDRMIKTIAEDLARVKRWRNQLQY